MNKISKYVTYQQRFHLLSTNILHQSAIHKHELYAGKLALPQVASCFQTIRCVSNTSKTSLSNFTDANDSLLTSIKSANRTSDVLEMLRLHNPVMSPPQHIQALNSLFLLQKNKRTLISNEELTRSPEFTALCLKIQRNSRNLDLHDILNNIKCLSYLGVSVKSNIMQMQLQLISKMINDMSLKQITFLHFLLKELSSCPMVDALKLALPIVFETQIHYKLEDNVFWQVEFLNYVTKHNLSQETFDFIMSKIILNIDQINPKIVKNLLLCLYYKDYSTEKYIGLINRCLQMYTNHTEFIIDFFEIEAILSRMIHKYLKESKMFYNEEFINKVIEFTIEKQSSFESIAYVVKKLNKIGYVHRGLLDYMTSQLNSNNEILEKSKFGVLLSYIAACANANYIPSGFTELKPLILKRFNVQKDVLELPWLLVVFDLVVLDCWSEELLERVFSRDFLYGFLNRGGHIQDYVMLLKLYQATMTFYPGGYKGTLPPTEIIEKAIDIYQRHINDFPLKAPLEHGLGGKDYVLTKVKSRLGHFVDHLVVMRPGGYSVAFTNELNKDKSNLFIEDIVKSNDNLVIGILLYKENSYVINLNCLRGPYALTNKTIEALGIVVLPISLDVWEGLIDFEKIPYIMRELKSKTEENSKTEDNMH